MADNLLLQQWSFAGGTIRFEIRTDEPIGRDLHLEEPIGQDHYDRIGEVCAAIKLLAMELDAAERNTGDADTA